uniref:Uncharacterized protein n=1 Tax=Engystomops pustulosus TaxID=76066 RepID=A0AAV6YQT4_ENGPU|nr:hypothetical protein GDO81_021601 [Engystomops pustulosus]
MEGLHSYLCFSFLYGGSVYVGDVSCIYGWGALIWGLDYLICGLFISNLSISYLPFLSLYSVTNGNEVWRTDPVEEALEDWDAVRNVTSRELVDKLREKFQNSAPVLDVQGSIATLTFQVDSGKVTLDLLKLPISEARAQVQEVLFDLSDCVRSLEAQLKDREGSAAASASPVKQSQRNHLLLIPDVDPRKKGLGGSSARVKKRLPGESLINPGSKR